MPDLENFKKRRSSQLKENKKFFLKLRRFKSREIDGYFHQYHQEVFNETNCLDCANCCKTTSPIFTDKDVNRMSAKLGIKPPAFIEKYLRRDAEGDLVLTSTPCVFLSADNRCSVYEYRPQACREYPHTNRRKMIQILSLTQKNTQVCPAVLEIVERMKKKINNT